MYGLIALYLGYVIYLVVFFRFHQRSALAKKITILLGIKLLLITILYFSFFSQKITKSERQKNIESIIVN
jgi:hypothetical protein